MCYRAELPVKAEQIMLFEQRNPRQHLLMEAFDTINAKYGKKKVCSTLGRIMEISYPPDQVHIA